MSPHARKLLRRIALGLPIVTAPAAGIVLLASASACTCGGTGNCGQPYAATMHAIDATQHARLFVTAGTIDSAGCRNLCLELDVSGPNDGGIDGGGGDAGLSQAPYSNVTCTVASPSGVETVTCTYAYQCIGGRAPAGLAQASVRESGIGGWLARAAYLERASVPAFEELAEELTLHGAPSALARGCIRAAADERRHAEVVAALAEVRGASTPDVRRVPATPRGLAELARENAAEGCVREAYAALVAAHQAASAADTDVRAAYATIAADEARHALLSFAIHDWAMRTLPEAEAASIERERRETIASWRASLLEPTPELQHALGLPDHDASLAMLDLLA